MAAKLVRQRDSKSWLARWLECNSDLGEKPEPANKWRLEKSTSLKRTRARANKIALRANEPKGLPNGRADQDNKSRATKACFLPRKHSLALGSRSQIAQFTRPAQARTAAARACWAGLRTLELC